MATGTVLDVDAKEYIAHFAFPPAPDMVFPIVSQFWAEVVLWTITALFAIYSLREWKKNRFANGSYFDGRWSHCAV